MGQFSLSLYIFTHTHTHIYIDIHIHTYTHDHPNFQKRNVSDYTPWPARISWDSIPMKKALLNFGFPSCRFFLGIESHQIQSNYSIPTKSRLNPHSLPIHFPWNHHKITIKSPRIRGAFPRWRCYRVAATAGIWRSLAVPSDCRMPSRGNTPNAWSWGRGGELWGVGTGECKPGEKR